MGAEGMGAMMGAGMETRIGAGMEEGVSWNERWDGCQGCRDMSPCPPPSILTAHSSCCQPPPVTGWRDWWEWESWGG